MTSFPTLRKRPFTALAPILVAVSLLAGGCGERKGPSQDELLPPEALEGGGDEGRKKEVGTAAQREAFMARLRAGGEGAPIPLATYHDGLVFTTEDLENYLRYYQPREIAGWPVEAVYQSLDFERFRQILREVVSNYLLADVAAGMRPPQQVQQRLADERDRSLLSLLFKHETEGGTEEMSREEAYREMALNLDKHTIPLQFTVSQLFFSAYTEYEMRPGDTLASVAKEIAGDERAAVGVRAPDTKARIWVAPQERGIRPYTPPRPGDKVLVPMGAVERLRLEREAHVAFRRIEAGESLEAVGKDLGFSEADLSPIGPLPYGSRPLFGPIYAAAKDPTWEVGETTGVIETLNGFHIVQLLNRQEPGVTPFDEAYEKMLEEKGRRRAARTEREFLRQLGEDLLVFDEDVLLSDDAPGTAVVAEALDWKLRVKDLEQLRIRLRYIPRTLERRRNKILDEYMVQRAVGLARAIELGLDRAPEFEKRLRSIMARYLSEAYLDYKAEERLEVSEEAVREYFENHIDDYTQPARYEVWEIALKAKDSEGATLDRAMKELEDLAPRLGTLEAFRAEARQRHHSPALRRRDGERGWVTEKFRGDNVARALDDAPTGAPMGPFEVGDEAVLIWISDKRPAVPRSFEDVAMSVERRFRKKRIDELRGQIRDEVLEEADFELLLKGS